MGRRRTTGPYRLYSRNQGGVERWYADFPDYADVFRSEQGKGLSEQVNTRVALKTPGASRATDDLETAKQLAEDKLVELREKRRNGLQESLKTTSLALMRKSISNPSGSTAGSAAVGWISRRPISSAS